MSRISHLLVVALFALALAACGGDENGDPEGFPGTADGAKALLTQFLQEGADTAALSAALRPTSEDYATVYVGEAGKKVESAYNPGWDAGKLHIRPKAGQTELLLWGATSEELKSWTGNAAQFPGGYKGLGPHLKPGVTLYRFKFVKPGEKLGMAFDGLTHVNGHWVIFPKSWSVLR